MKLPWDIPTSDRALYEPICAKSPEDRTPLESLAKIYIDLCAQSVGDCDALRLRAQKAERALETIECTTYYKDPKLRSPWENQILQIIKDSRERTRDEFIDECGPLPTCQFCHLDVGVCECPRSADAANQEASGYPLY